MKRQTLGSLFIIAGLGLACILGAVLFYQNQCPNLETIETAIPDDAEVEITLDRSICFGTCPIYTLHIDGRGHVVYDGRDYVRVTGQHEAQMSQAGFQKLVQAFETYNFYALVAEYHRAANPICSKNAFDRWTDAPSTTLGLAVNGRLTQIEHYHGFPHAPDALSELERLVDELAGSDRWVE